MALNAGHFSRQKYDTCYYPEDVYQSTSPYSYITDTNKIYNCNGCITTFGPGPTKFGPVGSLAGDRVAAAQENINIDSILTNRNVPISRCRKGKVNPIDVTKIRTKNLPVCDDYLDAQHTKMTDSAMFYRGAPINRFYDLPKDPQANIFYDWAVNTSLEMKDNFVPELPCPLTEVDLLPDVPKGKIRGDRSWNPKVIEINPNGNCGNRGSGARTRPRVVQHPRYYRDNETVNRQKEDLHKEYNVLNRMSYPNNN